MIDLRLLKSDRRWRKTTIGGEFTLRASHFRAKTFIKLKWASKTILEIKPDCQLVGNWASKTVVYFRTDRPTEVEILESAA